MSAVEEMTNDCGVKLWSVVDTANEKKGHIMSTQTEVSDLALSTNTVTYLITLQEN